MSEKNTGKGIFYGVIGVATLIVAIIGATFAYFTASQQNAENIAGTTAASAGIELTVTPVTDTGNNLIPLNLVENDGSKDAVDQFADALGTTKGASCQDSNGNNVCQVYSITVKNLSTTSTINVRGTLVLDGASAPANIKWQLLSASDATSRANFATVVAKGTTGDITVGGNTGSTGSAAASQNLAKEASTTYYVLVWLEEMGEAQETSDASKSFTGTVKFNAVDASGKESGLTATFSAGA